jgi:hypothetical protein
MRVGLVKIWPALKSWRTAKSKFLHVQLVEVSRKKCVTVKKKLATSGPVLPDGAFFKPKIPIRVNFKRSSCNGRLWYFCGNYVYLCRYFTAKWYILWPFGTY